MALMLPDPAASAGEFMFIFSLIPDDEPASGQQRRHPVHRADQVIGILRTFFLERK